MTQSDRTNLIGSSAIKVPVKVATTAAITLSGEQTIDGISCVDGDRVLVKNQTDAKTNGIYTVDTGAWSRATDFDGSYDVVKGTLVAVVSGTVNGPSFWQVTSENPIVIGTTDIGFALRVNALSGVSAFVQALLDDLDDDAFIQTLFSGANLGVFRTTVGFPDTGTPVTATAAQTLTNKTLTAAILGGTTNLSGGQLQFPATQNASADANTLDDYEEGTWSPNVGGSATYTVQAGRYIKISRMVFVHCRVLINSIGTGDTTTIFGLPFVAMSGNPGDCAINVEWGSTVSTFVYISGRIVAGFDQIGFLSATAATDLLAVNSVFKNSTDIEAAGSYSV